MTYHHLVNGINYMKHFCLCYVAIIIQVIEFKRPCGKLIDIDVCTQLLNTIRYVNELVRGCYSI